MPLAAGSGSAGSSTTNLPFGLHIDSSLGDDRLLVLVIMVAAVILTSERTSWHLLRNVVTIAHEGGHALAAVLMRRELAGIKLHSDTSGVTLSRGKPDGLGMVFTAAAGYPAPSLIGVGGAALIGAGQIRVMLWVAVALLVILLSQIRNVFGVVTVVGTGAAAVAVIIWGSERANLGFACALTWLLLVGGLRAVVELQGSRRAQAHRSRGRATLQSDADQLAWLSHLPGLIWVFLFFLVSLAALVAGGWLMLR